MTRYAKQIVVTATLIARIVQNWSFSQLLQYAKAPISVSAFPPNSPSSRIAYKSCGTSAPCPRALQKRVCYSLLQQNCYKSMGFHVYIVVRASKSSLDG